VANYSVDIEVALKGVDKLRDFDRIITNSVNELNKLEKALKNVKQQNPYDVSGARRVTELDKLRLNIIKETNRALSEQERIQRGINSEIARQNLAMQVQARRAASPGVQRRTIASIAYPEGAGPGMGPGAQRNIDLARMQRVTNARITTAYPGPIGPGPASPAALRSPVARRIQEALARQALIENAGFGVQGPAMPPARPSRNFIPPGLQGRLGGAASNAIIGGAFPLLFGQGAGAAAGGAIGGGLGGLLGGQFGFGLSLVGTLIGDIASKGQKIKELGEDIGFSSQQTQQLANAFKVANTDIEKFTGVIQNVRGVGLALEDQARAVQLITTLTDKYGGSFEKVGNAITSALESGKVSQATLNQLSSQGIDIQGALAAKYKTSRDTILKMAKDGTVSVQTLIDTLVEMGNKGADATNKPKTAMQNLQDSVDKLGDAVKNLGSKLVTTLGPVFKWLTDRVTEFVNAVSRAISRLADLMAGGRMTQATIQAETAAQKATTGKFGVLGGIRAINPAAEAFFQQEKTRQLKTLAPGAFASTTPTTPLETFRAPSQAAPGGAAGRDRAAERAAKAAEKEALRVAEVVRNRMAEAQIMRLQSTIQDRIAAAEVAKDPMLVARLEGQQKILDLQFEYAKQLANETSIRAQQAIIFEGQTAIVSAQRDTERELAEIARTDGQRRLDDMQKYIEQQYELNTAVKQQKELAESISGSLNQGLVSTFDLLIQGAENWQQSLQQIASGVLIDIANQLLRIFVIEQAINAIRTFLTPFNPATPLGAGGGTVGKFGTFGPNYGIAQRAAGGPVSAGSPYLVGERGPEMFVPRSSGSIYPNDAMGMGGANVIVNVDASGTSAQGNDGQANQLGKVIGAAVQAELIKQRRPGGLLA